jgi:hypothetical protein
MYVCINATVVQFRTYTIFLSLQRIDRERDSEHEIRQRAAV